MTPGRLRTKLRKIRERGEEMAEEGGELNLVPYLDIVTNVIMFMLATTTFAAALGDINASSPTSAPPSVSQTTPPPPPDQQDLNLTVNISDKGFTIASSGIVLYQGYTFDAAGNVNQTTTQVPTLPKKPNGEYDYELLAKKMMEIKKLPVAANQSKVIVNAAPTITYEIVVQVLDACRGKAIEKPDPSDPNKKIEAFEGFGDVLLSAGVN